MSLDKHCISNIFKFVTQAERAKLRQVCKSWKRAGDINWDYCVLPDFRGNSAKQHFLNDPSSRITLNYFCALIGQAGNIQEQINAFLNEVRAQCTLRLIPTNPRTGEVIEVEEAPLPEFDEEKLLPVAERPKYRKIRNILLNFNDLDLNHVLNEKTPLLHAIGSNCHLVIIETLINFGAKITFECFNRASQYPEIFKFLLDRCEAAYRDEETFNRITSGLALMKERPFVNHEWCEDIDGCIQLLTETRENYYSNSSTV